MAQVVGGSQGDDARGAHEEWAKVTAAVCAPITMNVIGSATETMRPKRTTGAFSVCRAYSGF